MNVWEALIERLWGRVVKLTAGFEADVDDNMIAGHISGVIERALDAPEMTFLKLAELVHTMDMEFFQAGNHYGMYLPMSANEFLTTIVHQELYTVLTGRWRDWRGQHTDEAEDDDE